jgi:hypothetical protein
MRNDCADLRHVTIHIISLAKELADGDSVVR